jgi:hypothetical protein
MQASSLGTIPESTREQQALLASDRVTWRAGVTVGPGGIHALDVGEHDELAGLQRDRERGRGGVGVDVEDLAGLVEVGCDRRHHRDPAGREDVEDGGGVDLDDVADQAEVDLLAVDDGAARAPEEAGVLAGEPDGERAVLVEQADEFAPTWPGEHHPDDVHDLGRGDPQAARNSLVRPEPLEHRPDLRAAAVDDDGRNPAYRRKAMSWAKAVLRVSSVIALPPYLTTTSAPRKRSSHGSASTRVASPWLGQRERRRRR